MITLQICQGTTCYILGAAKLTAMALDLPPDLKPHVKVTGCRCLGLCHNGEYGDAPYIKIDDKPMSGADPDMMLVALRERLAEITANGGGNADANQ